MQKNKYPIIIRAIGITVLVGVVFVVGAYAGTRSSVAELIAPGSVHASESASARADLVQFWSVWSLLDQKYPFKKDIPESKEKVYGAISGLVASYGDPYTVFFPPKEAKLFEEEVKGSFGGVGMEVGIRDGIVTVIAPIKGSPAEKVGIKAGDIVVKIGDKETDDMDIDTAISLIRGDVGTNVTIEMLRVGVADPLTFTVTREIIKLPTLDTEIVGDVFVISLYSFSADASDMFRDALEQFNKSGKRRLVIDLRNNPGGYLDAAVNIASYLLPAGKTVVRENSGLEEPELVHQSKGYGKLSKYVKIAVLVNGGSASASEILAGALSEHGVATLVGTKTFGKGSVQELIELKDGSSVKITVAKWLTPKGVSISEKGITPKIVVEKGPYTDEKTGKEIDPQLDAAIQALR